MIRTTKFFKVYEQANDDSGCGAIVASFPAANGGKEAAEAKAADFARRLSPRRYYVLEAVSAVYAPTNGGDTVRRVY